MHAVKVFALALIFRLSTCVRILGETRSLPECTNPLVKFSLHATPKDIHYIRDHDVECRPCSSRTHPSPPLAALTAAETAARMAAMAARPVATPRT